MNRAKRIITELLSRISGSKALAPDQERRLSVLNPVLELLDGRRTLQRAEDIDEQSLALGLSALIGVSSGMLSVQGVPIDAIEGLPTECNDYELLSLDIAYSEFERLFGSVDEAIVHEVHGILMEALLPGLECLAERELARATDHFELDLLHSVLAPYFVLSACAVVYIAKEDILGFARVAPHLRHLGQVTPVGVLPSDSYSWIVLCRP